jgi:hypothetical protein
LPAENLYDKHFLAYVLKWWNDYYLLTANHE